MKQTLLTALLLLSASAASAENFGTIPDDLMRRLDVKTPPEISATEAVPRAIAAWDAVLAATGRMTASCERKTASCRADSEAVIESWLVWKTAAQQTSTALYYRPDAQALASFKERFLLDDRHTGEWYRAAEAARKMDQDDALVNRRLVMGDAMLMSLNRMTLIRMFIRSGAIS